MKISRSLALVAAAIYVLVVSPVSAIQKLPEDNDSNQQRQAVPFVNGTKGETLSFNDLPIGIATYIIDYLTYHDQFRLALTNRNQLFLWTSIGRVPSPASVPTATSDVTYLHWSGSDWPANVNQTVIIEVSQHIRGEELTRLNALDNLENILHLHFKGKALKEPIIVIAPLLEKNDFSDRFSSLKSLLFNKTTPYYDVVGDSLQTLQNFIVEGRAIPRKKKDQYFDLAELAYYRPNLNNLRFFNSQLEAKSVIRIMNSLSSESKNGHRLLEIVNNTIDVNGQKIKEQKPWREGFYFPIKPWVIDENGDARVRFYRGFLPGPSRERYVTIQMPQEEILVPWHRLFNFLSPTYLSVVDLLPLFRTWATEARLRVLNRLLPESRIEREAQGRLTFVLPPDLQQPFYLFQYESEKTSASLSAQQEEKKLQPDAQTTLASSVSLLQRQEEAEFIRVAASRHSEEVLNVPTEALIEVIRDNAQSNASVRSYLNQIPQGPSRQSILGWFREVLEFFVGDAVEDSKEPNNAEVLVGEQLMSALRGLLPMGGVK